MLGTFLGGGEIILILALILILLGAKRLPGIAKVAGEGLRLFLKEVNRLPHDAGKSLGGIYGKPAAEALTPDNQTAELYNPAVFQRQPLHRSFGEFLRELRRRIVKWFRMKH